MAGRLSRLLVAGWLACSAVSCPADKPPRPPPPSTGTPEPATSPVEARRLSHAEYENTLRDLFPFLELDDFSLAQDPRRRGFSNDKGALLPSDLLVEQYAAAALAVAREIEPHMGRVLPCSPEAGKECAERFIREFGLRTFRRPLAPEEVRAHLDLFDKPGTRGNFTLGTQLVVLSMLQSPSFLYRYDGNPPSDRPGTVPHPQFQLASRLSYFLWASMPDDELFRTASAGKLSEAAEVRSQVRRMLQHPRARQGILLLFREWLQLDRITRIDRVADDTWNATLQQELLQSVERFVYDEIFERGGTSADLLTSAALPATPRIARLVGRKAKHTGWKTLEVDARQRAGLLTHPAFLSAHAHVRYPSPVLRGVYVLDRLLCKPPESPPGNFSLPPPPTKDSPRTNRAAYTRATAGRGCATCHSTINPLGFAFEHFDSLGRFRNLDGGLQINATGKALEFEFDGAVELATQVSHSPRYRGCVVEMWLRYAMGGVTEDKERVSEELLAKLGEGDFEFKALVEAIATHPSFMAHDGAGATAVH